MKKSKWFYTDQSRRCGTMVCQISGKPISGDYRYKELFHKGEFLGYCDHQSRECCPDAPEWKKRDEKETQRVVELREKLQAFKDFAKKWPDEYHLEDCIFEMEEELNMLTSTE